MLKLIPSGRWSNEFGSSWRAGGLLWISKDGERRFYSVRATEAEKVWDDVEETDQVAKALGAQWYPREDFKKHLLEEIAKIDSLHFPFDDLALATEIFGVLSSKRRLRKEEARLIDLREELGLRRLIKTDAQIQKMRDIAQRSARAHAKVQQISWIGKTEKDVAFAFASALQDEGVQEFAYKTIVAAGERALILHGRPTDRKIEKEDLILIDAGGFLEGACADITRTWSASGKLTGEQKKIHDIVSGAQKAAIAKCVVGSSLDEVHETAKAFFREALLAEGETFQEEWFPHRTSHWLGIEVHEAAPYYEKNGEAIRFETGMILTVEPGLYFRGEKAPAKWRGIGVRIEDDILITDKGPETLSDIRV